MPPTPPVPPGRAQRRGCLRRLLIAVGLLALVSLAGLLALKAWRASVDRELDAN